MSFQLIDQILSIRPGEQATGVLQPGAGAEALPLGLLVEAVGQLASWATIPELEFDHRPVAASAGLVEVLRVPAPGAPLEIQVTITAIRRQAISYHGIASSEGTPCLSLQRAIGPLLPMEEFDDKNRVKRLFEELCADGIAPRRAIEPADYQPTILLEPGESGKGLAGSFRLPEESIIYGDHFPRQPVFPATLLLQTQIDATRKAYARPDGSLPEIRELRGVKIRAFSGPGEQLSFRAIEQKADESELQFRLESNREETRVSAATLYLRP